MTFQHTDDIDENKATFIPRVNEQFTTAVNRVINAMEKASGVDSEFRSTISLLLQSLLYTHKSIIVLLRHGNEERYDPGAEEKDRARLDMTLSADAMSLLREQLEKVFVVALLCDDPARWTKAYLMDDLRRFYEQYLTQRDEMKDLPRSKQFYDVIAPEMLEQFRQRVNIQAGELEAIEYRYYNPKGALPNHLQPYIDATRLFPTPGAIKASVADPAKPFLERLHKEYKFVNGYNHAGMLKIQLLAMSDRRYGVNVDEAYKETFYQKEVLLPAVWTSYIAGVCACTEVLKFIPGNVEVLGALTMFWESLRRGALLARAMWELRGKTMFPGII